jgi:membrane-associated phospholipid phosphatase
MFNKYSHPATYRLLQIALRVGQFLAMHYKYNPGMVSGNPLPPRPRPSQISPALLPPITVPGHASYPSGHATEAYMVAGILKRVMPPAASTVTEVGNLDSTPLRRLAERIARNREVLGLHYPSDSKAGKFLADQTESILASCATVNTLIGIAPNEWT